MAIRELNIEQVEAVSGGATTFGAVLTGVGFVAAVATAAFVSSPLLAAGAVVGAGAAALAYVYDAATDASGKVAAKKKD